MRSQRTTNDHVAEVARRRLELLGAELAAIRPPAAWPPSSADGSGELFDLPAVSQAPARPVEDRAPGRHARRPVGAGRLLAGWCADRLPAALQGRVRIGAAHVAVLALGVAVAMAALAWWSVRAADPGELAPAGAPLAAPPPLVTPEPVPSTGGSSPAPGADGSPGGPVGEVVVDVAGRVRRPGIVTLPVGSRVVDALEAAGGARRGVSLRSLNLARLLVDGEQILVGVRPVAGVAPPAAAAPPGAPGPLVNLNTAGLAELDTLPGVGPVTAQAILDWRAEHGAFTAVDELLEVSGIGEVTLAEIAPFVTL